MAKAKRTKNEPGRLQILEDEVEALQDEQFYQDGRIEAIDCNYDVLSDRVDDLEDGPSKWEVKFPIYAALASLVAYGVNYDKTALGIAAAALVTELGFVVYDFFSKKKADAEDDEYDWD